jgi:hypothetical protein
MDAYIYGERRPLPEGFAAYHDRWRSAVVSIDMHQGHLADTPDCPCPAPRARELVAPIDAFHDQARGLGVPIGRNPPMNMLNMRSRRKRRNAKTYAVCKPAVVFPRGG